MKYRKVSAEQVGRYGEPVLRIFARGEDGQKYKFDKKGLPSYFFLPCKPEYPPDLASKVRRIEGGYKSLTGKDLWKIYTYSPGDTNALRQGFEHFEADVHWTERACIDLKLTDGFRIENGEIVPDNGVDHIPLRVWVVDVEISSPPTVIPDYNTPTYPTVCVVVYDSYDKRQYTFSIKHMDEKSMWEGFLNLIEINKPDIITGWNVGFDVSWIIARLSNLGIDPNRLSPMRRAGIRHWTAPDGRIITKFDIAGIVIFDGLEAYKVKKNPSGQLSSYNLHAIAEKELNVHWEDLGPRIEEEWKRNKDNVIAYCQKDVDYEWQIIKKERLIDQSLTLCRLSGCTPPQTLKKEAIIDHALLLRRGDRILPSKRKNRDAEFNVKGAVVLLPRAGIHKCLGVFDAAALYPSIIAGFNISFETKDPNGKVIIKDEDGNVYRFKSRDEQLGILPETIAEFRNLREQVRARKRNAEETYGHDSPEFKALEEEDTADKFIITSFYGVNSFAGFRLFDPDCANAITAVGRQIILGLKEYLGNHGYPVEYGDTDSVFVSMSAASDESKVESEGAKVSELIANFLDEKLTSMGVTGTAIDVKFEKFFEWCIFKQTEVKKGVWEPVKKKYVAHMTYTEGSGGKMEKTDYMYVRGFETRRSDTSPILKDTMNKIFDEKLRHGDFIGAVEVLKSVKKRWKDYDPITIAIPRKVNSEKSFNKKLGREIENAWQRGVRFGKEKFKFQYDDQSAPSLLYIDRAKGMPDVDVICIQEHHNFPQNLEIDYPTMWEKVIKKKFEPLLQAMDISWDKEIEGQQGIDQWF